MKLKVALLLMLMLTGKALADSYTGNRTITQMGCHLNDGTCYLSISGNSVGPAECTNTSIRWNKDVANSERIFSLLMAAYLSGKKVDFHISNNCYTEQPAFPTFSHVFIRD